VQLGTQLLAAAVARWGFEQNVIGCIRIEGGEWVELLLDENKKINLGDLLDASAA
jgi:hypothetical protein